MTDKKRHTPTDTSSSFANRTGELMQWSANNKRAVVGCFLVFSLLAVAVLIFDEPNVKTDVQAGTFPHDDPQANAFRDLRAEVSGINSELVYLELLPNARGPDGQPVTNVTSQTASLAIEEMFSYVERRFGEEQEQKIIDYTGYPFLLKLVNSYFPDGGYEIPAEDYQYARAQQLLEATGDASLAFYFSEDYRSTIISILYDPAGDKKATAGLINELIAEYRNLPVGPDKEYQIWDAQYLDAWGVQSWIYRVDESVQNDLGKMVPVVVLALFAALAIAMRSPTRALASLMVVGFVQIWTLAAMSLLDLSIGFISMALFPLLLGVGVDYAIHIDSEARAAKIEPFRRAGQRSGIALIIATATTVTGFLVIMLSRSPMIIEVATATTIGMSLMLLASLTFMPAAMAFTTTKKRQSTPRQRTSRIGAWRPAIAVFLVAGSAVLVPYVGGTQFAIDTVQGNLPARPEPSHMLVMFDRFAARMDASGQEAFIHQGDLARSDAMLELIDIHLAMEKRTELFDGVLSLPFVLDLYKTLEGDGNGIGPVATIPQLLLSPVAPQERFAAVKSLDDAQVREAFDGMWSDERWSPLIRSFTNHDYSITWTFSFVEAATDIAATIQATDAMEAILAETSPAMDTHYFGTLTALHRINNQAQEWLIISAIADVVGLGILVAAVTRSLKAAAVTTSIMALGMAWWLGILALPFVDIRISFVYLIPMAFITSIGSDYSVHLVIGQKEKQPREAFKRTTWAIIFSTATTAVAFAIFSRGQIPGSAQMFTASVIAVFVAAVLAIGAVALAYPAATAAPTQPATQPAAEVLMGEPHRDA